jgi:hypothetical protein
LLDTRRSGQFDVRFREFHADDALEGDPLDLGSIVAQPRDDSDLEALLAGGDRRALAGRRDGHVGVSPATALPTSSRPAQPKRGQIWF